MNRKSRFHAAGLFAMLFAAGLFFASCSGELDAAPDDSLINSGAATVSFAINGNLAASVRTALPSVHLDSYAYTIKAKRQDTGAEETLASGLKVGDLSNQRFTMARTSWVFSVLAYLITKDESTGKETISEKPVFEGESKVIDLVNRVTAVVNMALRATTTGIGCVQIPVTYSSKGVKKVTCGLYTSATGDELLEGKSLQTYTPENGITDNGDGTYSLTFSDDAVPSGKTVYARFVLYDANDVPVGYYTEAVYVADGQTSAPVVYIKNEDGTYKQDENGNFIPEENPDPVEVDANLFPAEVSAETGKKVYAETTVKAPDGTEKKVVYELYDEDGDGKYDTVLPPGDYTIKVGEADGTPETAVPVEDAKLDVGTGGGSRNVLKLDSVRLSTTASDGIYHVGNTLGVTAWTSTNQQIPAPSSDVSIKWLYADTETGEYAQIEGIENSATYKLPGKYAGKFIKVVVTQNFNGETIEKEFVTEVKKGNFDAESYALHYEGMAQNKVLSGTTLDKANLVLTGLKDTDGNDIADASLVFATEETLDSSKTVTVKISAAGYETIENTLFITVKKASPAVDSLPGLKAGGNELPKDAIEFALTEADLGKYEYSLDGGTTWKAITQNPIFVAHDIKNLLVRIASVGEEGKDGYIEHSEGTSVAVSEDKIGTRTVELDSVVFDAISPVKVGYTLSPKALAQTTGEDITGLVAWKWFRSAAADGEFTVISGETAATYRLVAEDIGMFIKAQASYYLNERAAVTTAAVIKGTLDVSGVTAAYGESATAGENLNNEKLALTGTLKDSAGNTIENFTAAIPTAPLDASTKVTATVSVPGYDDALVDVFVTVKAAVPTGIPALSTNVGNIPSGKIEFEVASGDLGKYEWSLDGETWQPLTGEQILVGESAQILVRTVAKGTEKEAGYIAPSDSVSVSTVGHVGTRPELASVSLPASIKVAETAAAEVKDAKGASVTAGLTWQWYTAASATASESEWTLISGATESSYKPLVSDLGKYLAVKVRYTEKSDKFVSAVSTNPVAKGTLPTGALSAAFGGILMAGDKISASDITVKNAEGNTLVLGTDYTLEDVPADAFTASKTVTVKINVSGYEPYEQTVYVLVKAVAPEASAIPALRTDVDEISGGHIAFSLSEGDAGKYEYSKDAEETWHTLTAEQISLPSGTSSVYVRLSATGTAGEDGYLAPSDKVGVEIKNENWGTKPVVRVSVTISGDIAVEKTVSGSTVELTASTGFTGYTWKVDGASAAGVAGVTVDGAKLTIDTSTWKTGEYKIGLTARKNDFDFSSTATVSIKE